VLIKVFINHTERTLRVDEGAAAIEILETLGLEENEHLVLKGGSLLPLDETLHEGDVLEVMRVVTGG